MTGILCGPHVGAGAGGGGEVVDAPDDSIYNLRRAVWKLGADGFIYRNGTASVAWITPQVNMAAYEIRVDLAAGSDPLDVNAGLGVWLSAVTGPSWGYFNTYAKVGNLAVQIRRASDGVVVDTATIDVEIAGGDVLPHNRFDTYSFE